MAHSYLFLMFSLLGNTQGDEYPDRQVLTLRARAPDMWYVIRQSVDVPPKKQQNTFVCNCSQWGCTLPMSPKTTAIILPKSVTLTKIIDDIEFICIFKFKQFFVHACPVCIKLKDWKQQTTNLFFALSCPPSKTKGQHSTIPREKKRWIRS